MKTSWTKGLSEEKALLTKRTFEESIALRKRLKEMLEEKIVSSRNEAMSKDLYDNVNWVYRQADSVGYQRAITEIISIISD